jgi:hypothetical protein
MRFFVALLLRMTSKTTVSGWKLTRTLLSFQNSFFQTEAFVSKAKTVCETVNYV